MALKYKVGDKVRIKSIDWYNKNKGNADKTNSVWCEDSGAWFFYHMSQYCGKIMTIKNVWAYSYTLEGSDNHWTDEMIEGLVEDTTKPEESMSLVEEEIDLIPKFGEYSDIKPLDIPTMTTEFVKEHGLPCPNGYIFKDENGNVINATKILLEKKKPKYPQSYVECCKVLDTEDDDIINISVPLHYNHLLIDFTQLLICRDAYWKIAGEEMGLGKPWEPDYAEKVVKYCLRTNYGRIVQTRTSHDNHPFSFPTEEMREAFYEAFKQLIEECKELL